MKNILFVCTGNSARSIIAESIINNEYSNKFKAYSAGSNPTGKINEDVKRFLEKNKNYDLFEYRSKNFEDFLSNNIKIDYVVTVCNNANNEVCPIWPDKNQIIHWDIEDPVSKLLNSNENEKNILINNTFNQINKNIIDWIANEK
ncbi:arsenate reductase ArsC [Candidatus Pelagibacter sp.]|jgi:protein-tyrosine-phosphatase|nr:arsenate reductase ArsC [Candidatus Pelagibacter sp.]|tara:strand:- start:997 stop:1431 length:435 start_codon:yes stop_codon:yes gene_type:complete